MSDRAVKVVKCLASKSEARHSNTNTPKKFSYKIEGTEFLLLSDRSNDYEDSATEYPIADQSSSNMWSQEYNWGEQHTHSMLKLTYQS
jgi:hypothetical protein